MKNITPVKFEADLKIMVRLWKKSLKRVYDTYSKEERKKYRIDYDTKNEYWILDKPCKNIQIERLIKKLNKMKVKFTETYYQKDGETWLKIKTF